LSALIPGAPEAGEMASGLLEVPVNAVAPNPKQPRTHFADEELASLAASIREVGILQPIVVRKSGDSAYELVAGERRLRAAKQAGLATVPVVVRDTDDADILREALIENIHREDLGPIKLAEAFRALLEDLSLKQEELADRRVLGAAQVRIGLDHGESLLARLLEDVLIAGQLRHREVGQAALLRAQELARAAQLQVRLRDAEAVAGLLHYR
jgi:ParB/RepB/Spo0J family partition protein